MYSHPVTELLIDTVLKHQTHSHEVRLNLHCACVNYIQFLKKFGSQVPDVLEKELGNGVVERASKLLKRLSEAACDGTGYVLIYFLSKFFIRVNLFSLFDAGNTKLCCMSLSLITVLL